MMRTQLLTVAAATMLAVAVSFVLMLPTWTKAEEEKGMSQPNVYQPTIMTEDVAKVSPALERYTNGPVRGDLWKRPDLSPRDRSIVTLAALVARNQTVEMPYYLDLALDSGVKPAEVSEVITHLAFYVGWPNAMSALPVAKEVFEKRPR